MKKFCKGDLLSKLKGYRKIFLIMKLSYLIIFLTTLNVSASLYSQSAKLDIAVKNTSVRDVLKLIEKQSEFRFFYSDDFSDLNKRVSLTALNQNISDILSSMLNEGTVTFKILENNVVVITPTQYFQNITVSGKVTDSKSGEPLIGVSITVQGTTQGTITDADGKYSVIVPSSDATLVFSFIGYLSENVQVSDRNSIDVNLVEDIKALEEVVVVGYGTQKKGSVTGSITGISAKDIGNVHGGSTVSSGLAGKLAGVTFRMPDGRPGASASVQIRNLGTPLYVIDGIQKDEVQFNNIAPSDIESITVLKDASAAIYGVKAANGVVVVTTKHGNLNTKNTINLNAYYGFQNWTQFPEVTNAYEWKMGKVYADVNQTGHSSITQAELDKWKAGTDPQYRSFDWYDAIVTPNMPQSSLNLNASGGNENVNYYVSLSRYDQSAVIKQYKFNRTNFQSNIDAKVSKSIKIGASINGRIEERVNPGVPGGDDYWVPRFAILKNTPMQRMFANDNPLYMNNIGDNSTNFALMNYATSGKFQDTWRVAQTNFNAEYKFPIKGLTAKGNMSYYFADQVKDNHEFTYDAYKYDPATDKYNKEGGSKNPWQEQQTSKIIETVLQGQLNYNNTFGKHTVGATFVTERSHRSERYAWVHVVPPLNPSDVMQVSTLDTYYQGIQWTPTVNNDLARVGYVARFNYDFAGKYYFEASGRRDASSKFSPKDRWGNFYSLSGGWRVSGEEFFKRLTGLSNVITDLKVRASYGQLGDDSNIGIDPWTFTYINGYSYPAGGGAVFGGQFTPGAQDRGLQSTDLSWTMSKITDIGVDYVLFNGKISGALDYFYRKRTGIPGSKNDVVLPKEFGFELPRSNVGSDAQVGGDMNIVYNGKINDFTFSVGGNWGYSRKKDLKLQYNPQFGNSWDNYRNSTIDRWDAIYWGLEVVGQFQSQDQINNYKVNNDGKGNKTQLPGDFIYNDQNKDGVINQYDQRPIGYPSWQNDKAPQPFINYGFSISAAWKGIDFHADFSGGSGYTYERNWESAWPYQNEGNLLKDFYNNSWKRVDPYDVNSAWIPGKYPSLTFNNRFGNNYQGQNAHPSFWLTKVKYLRARTIELGYTLPKGISEKMRIEKLRVYINTYNLFSFDNMKKYGLETEISDNNGLQYPQNRIVNLGLNLSF